MTYQSFLENIQKYFGNYENEHIGGYVLSYLKRDIKEELLSLLLRYILYYHAVRFGAPGISDIELCIAKALQNNKGSDVHKHETGKAIEIKTSIKEAKKAKETEQALDKIGLGDMFRQAIDKSRGSE